MLWQRLNYFLPLRPTPQSASAVLPPEAVKTIFGDINVLSIWVHFKSDACFILWRHLLTSEIPASVTAPARYIHNSEISVGEFGGRDAFGCGTTCNMADSPGINIYMTWRARLCWTKSCKNNNMLCCDNSYLVTFSTGRTPLLFPFKLVLLFFFMDRNKKKIPHLQIVVGKCHLSEGRLRIDPWS